jgi:tRNA pseudouridine38-40 synthase
MRLKLTIAYDGRPHAGWQSQPGGNTVQDLLERALAATAKQALRIHGAGRTDAGVHALAQTAHFDPPPGLSLNPHNWIPALNTKLPPSIRVMACEPVAEDFHARFSATGKIYQYDLCTDPVLSPFRAGFAWHLPQLLDPDTLELALAMFRGRHDFRAFAAFRGNETPGTDYHRTLDEVTWTALPDGYRMRFGGDGFLYRMVRLLTGTAVAAAQGRMDLAEIARLLESPGKQKTRHCAPADGLCLVEVLYQPEGRRPRWT